ncbi:MAG: zinc ribbon domain-containing protein [Deltaproteobacteria bacterium]|nr:zinc ribbon domain-containing protein [Deltaproteobacteria bacterium]
MPIYEFRCLGCRRVFSCLVGVVADSGEPECPRCGGKKLSKLISRPARIRSRQSLEDLADPGKLGNLDDPKAMAEWAKKASRALGDETGEDFEGEMDEMLENPPGERDEFDEE